MTAAYKMVPHNFSGKVCHWQYCTNCGLIRLRNGFTEWAVRMGCDNDQHPQFEHQRSQPGLK